MNKEQREELKRLASEANAMAHEVVVVDVPHLVGLLASLESAEAAMESQKSEWLSWDAKRAALEKDAERYRFWRNRYPETFKPTDITPEDVDRLTDEAMEAK